MGAPLGSINNPYKNIMEVIQILKEKNTFSLQQHERTSAMFKNINTSSYIAMGLGHNDFCFAPFTGSQYLFRGESEQHSNITPRILRPTEKPHYFLNKLRLHEFKKIIKQHFSVKKMEAERVLNCRFAVNYEGLAQHYGIPTHHLDLTSDIKIAAFFASCKYTNGKYEPLDSGIGVIYSFPIQFLLLNDFHKTTHALQPLGGQPFQRPGRQRGWSFNTAANNEPNNDMKNHATPLYFRHDSESSKSIHEWFTSRDEHLFPDDEISELVKHIFEKTSFSEEVFDCARSDSQNLKENSETLIRRVNSDYRIKITRDDTTNIPGSLLNGKAHMRRDFQHYFRKIKSNTLGHFTHYEQNKRCYISDSPQKYHELQKMKDKRFTLATFNHYSLLLLLDLVENGPKKFL